MTEKTLLEIASDTINIMIECFGRQELSHIFLTTASEHLFRDFWVCQLQKKLDYLVVPEYERIDVATLEIPKPADSLPGKHFIVEIKHMGPWDFRKDGSSEYVICKKAPADRIQKDRQKNLDSCCDHCFQLLIIKMIEIDVRDEYRKYRSIFPRYMTLSESSREASHFKDACNSLFQRLNGDNHSKIAFSENPIKIGEKFGLKVGVLIGITKTKKTKNH